MCKLASALVKDCDELKTWLDEVQAKLDNAWKSREV